MSPGRPDALNLVQSAVSAAINALETRHAVKLFHRVGRGIELTEAGSVFLGEARAVLARARRPNWCWRTSAACGAAH